MAYPKHTLSQAIYTEHILNLNTTLCMSFYPYPPRNVQDIPSILFPTEYQFYMMAAFSFSAISFIETFAIFFLFVALPLMLIIILKAISSLNAFPPVVTMPKVREHGFPVSSLAP